ncbi:hypothetical protein CHGG_09998 [Chaetomium globosum CBS 148.51]|uniref:Enoyl reductase (ER) domain-containing protein n=1 Tax=Chaetomium globosum (strain ATCC 6205 / CBS 148.51 / DSM 1962 / NBRC 6347 / NRRL 1970) TaxID=306901 RepID=Q2GPV6_CHAGB|nr:uncharacterized protein CHGG_09998 [Chaetomium globosum CBS 148.51]EAQ83594.1 hypothetical protein CHGG_09998 [Chaetomium globosum CBS 148.51]
MTSPTTTTTTAIPPTHLAFRRSPGTGTEQTPLPLQLTTEPTLPPSGHLGPHDVLVRVRAVSLNYRDALMLRGTYPGGAVLPSGIVASDCAGEVVAVGGGVTRFAVGERVVPTFVRGGSLGEGGVPLTLGGEVDGVLREFAVFGEEGLVRLPGHFVVGGGVRHWAVLRSRLGKAVGAPDSLDKNKSVLIQVTKLDTPDLASYNYRTNPDQVAEVQRLTGGKGVDYVVNNNGPPGIPADIDSLVPSDGVISIVGFLGGRSADWNPGKLLALIAKTARLQGIAAGSKLDFEALNSFLDEKQVRLDPLVDDKVFNFKDSQAALDYLWSGKHMGKVVIRV